MDLAALKAELLADPAGLGYAAPLASGGDNTLADLLNAPRPGISVSRGVVQGCEVINAIDATELAALTALQLQRLSLLTGASGGVDTRSAGTRAILGAAFGAGTTSRANLIALATRPGSRAEQLWGAGVVVGHLTIADARRA